MPPKKSTKAPTVVPAATPESIAAAQAAQATAAALADKYKQLQQLKAAASTSGSAALRAGDSSSASGGAAGASGVDKAKQLEAITLWKAKQQAQKEAAAIAALTAVGTAVVMHTPAAAAKAVEAKQSVKRDDGPPAGRVEPAPKLCPRAAGASATGAALEPGAAAALDDESADDVVFGSVFVANIPPELESDELIKLFKPVGVVENIRFGHGRKFAFAVFQAADAVQARRLSEACIKQFDNHDLGNGFKLRLARVRKGDGKGDGKRTWVDHDKSNAADVYNDESVQHGGGARSHSNAAVAAPTPTDEQPAKRAAIDWGFDDD
jgi:hypothetical protein